MTNGVVKRMQLLLSLDDSGCETHVNAQLTVIQISHTLKDKYI